VRKNASSTLSPVLADASMYIRPKEAKGQQCGAQVVKRGGQEPTVLLTKCGGLVVSHLSLRLQICAKAISRKSQVMYLSQREAPICLVADQHNHSVGVREIPGVGEPSSTAALYLLGGTGSG